MVTLLKKSVVFFMISLMVTLPLVPAVFGGQPEGYVDKDSKAGAMAADALIVRPFSLVATILGTAIFVVAVPFAALGGNASEAFDNLMAKPAKYTFVRPLGDFE